MSWKIQTLSSHIFVIILVNELTIGFSAVVKVLVLVFLVALLVATIVLVFIIRVLLFVVETPSSFTATHIVVVRACVVSVFFVVTVLVLTEGKGSLNWGIHADYIVVF